MARTEGIILEAKPEESPSPKTDIGTAADDEPLSRTDRFFITSMLIDDFPPAVTLSDDTVIGGATLNSIMELGYRELCNDMRLEESFESMHVMYLLEVQKVARECFQEVPKNKLDLHARDINLRYALGQLIPSFGFMTSWRVTGPKKTRCLQANAFSFHLHLIL